MTEVATLPQAGSLSVPAAGAPALNLTATTVSLLEWAQELEAAHRLGTALCGTEFVPASFRGKPEAAAAAILAGKSLGLDPMNALSNIFVVQGRPAMYARTMVALVLSAGHDVRRTAATPEAVTIMGRRKGQSEWQEFTWSIDRARQAGYLSNKKYASDPIAMLTAKAQAEACRTIAPDVLTGVAAYSVEDVELEDLGENPSQPAPAPASAAKRTVRRQQAPVPAVPDVVHEAPRDEAEPEPTAEPVEVEPLPEAAEQLQEPGCSMAQQKALGEALKKAGHTTKDAMMLLVSSWAGREITASKELTVTEARDLTNEILGSLESEAGQE
ncbi:hypothetical protein NNX28_16855 [Arthrobacter sp. zg-Y859]|uniref:RecT family protein n=1 Tax=Arthrobacter jinronghuae TaxID=2964609 RepID=A0ABT1NV27_9MICC|nr:hypothetical protein [Arthrobacter jinronghuae]MCQ1951589.1 hypothetical protein [Arthrobacter jinronghuae]UWX79696.1 hypothetical protein N2K98_05725 [Arthrobacter jinronghuae]